MEINRYLKQSGFAPIGPLIILAFLVIAAGAVVMWKAKVTPPSSPAPTPTLMPTVTIAPRLTPLPSPTPTLPLTPGTKVNTSKLHQSCGPNNECLVGQKCISYYGIAGPRGSLIKTCEIPCPNGDSDCPNGFTCFAISDGPGLVCDKIP